MINHDQPRSTTIHHYQLYQALLTIMNHKLYQLYQLCELYQLCPPYELYPPYQLYQPYQPYEPSLGNQHLGPRFAVSQVEQLKEEPGMLR